MKLLMFAVHDMAVNAFMTPFFSRAKGEAVRSFTDAANDKEHQFARHAHDYVLFYLGEFDDVGGLFSGVEPVRMLAARECVVDDVIPPASAGGARSNGRVAL